MKIVYLIDTLNVGGTERSLLELCSHQTNVESVVSPLYLPNTMASQFHEAGVRVRALGAAGRYQLRHVVSEVSRLHRLLSQLKPHARELRLLYSS